MTRATARQDLRLPTWDQGRTLSPEMLAAGTVKMDAISFSPASRCPERRQLFASSTDVGWTTVLLERHRLGARVEAGARRTPDVQLFVLTRGAMQLGARRSSGWQRWLYDVGTAGLLEARTDERLLLEPQRPVELAQLFVPASVFDEVGDAYRRAGRPSPPQVPSALGFRDATVADAMSALVRALDEGAPNLYAETFAYAVATHLLSGHWRGGAEADPRTDGRITEARLARVLEYMSVHFAEPLDLTRLAREAGVSKFHFARLFRERVSTTPHRHLVELRLAAARRMLAGTDRPVSEVAFACGYESAAHFGSAFRRRHGLSPGEFRRRRSHGLS